MQEAGADTDEGAVAAEGAAHAEFGVGGTDQRGCTTAAIVGICFVATAAKLQLVAGQGFLLVDNDLAGQKGLIEIRVGHDLLVLQGAFNRSTGRGC